MIEFSRYARLKPQGLVSAIPDGDALFVDFKRFDNENGKELPPERCQVTFAELADKAVELERDLAVVRELLTLKPK